MAAIDLKTLAPDTTFPVGAVLFGADSQTAASPSVYPLSSIRIPEYAVDLAGGVTIDTTAGKYFSKSITSAVTLAVTNVPATGTLCCFMLEITNTTGSLNLWSNIKWPSAVVPTITPNGKDIFGFITRDGGATWNGVLVAKDVK